MADSVNLDAPEHELCSDALRQRNDTIAALKKQCALLQEQRDNIGIVLGRIVTMLREAGVTDEPDVAVYDLIKEFDKTKRALTDANIKVNILRAMLEKFFDGAERLFDAVQRDRKILVTDQEDSQA